jgi:hypothetical protein
MQNKNQQSQVRSGEPKQNEHKETQPKFPQLKVQTDIRIGTCVWDPNCEKYWC